MRGRCETHCRGIGTADLAACEHVLLERKNLILPMDANITLVQSFGPPVTKSLREPVRLHLVPRRWFPVHRLWPSCIENGLDQQNKMVMGGIGISDPSHLLSYCSFSPPTLHQRYYLVGAYKLCTPSQTVACSEAAGHRLSPTVGLLIPFRRRQPIQA